jgi:hypothetical protein
MSQNEPSIPQKVPVCSLKEAVFRMKKRRLVEVSRKSYRFVTPWVTGF